MQRSLRKAGSNWVDGDRFFDREFEIEALSDRIRDGSHTLLTAQRRMGKTSLVRELLRRLAGESSHETIFVDLEGSADAADAVAEIAIQARSVNNAWQKIAASFANRARGALDRVDEIGVSELRVKLRAGVDHGTWQDDGDRIFKALASCQKPVVLAIDELPILVNRMAKGHDFRVTPQRRAAADIFLSWLRQNGQSHRGRIIFILAGSVGLQPVLRQAGLSAHANIFVPYELHPWDMETATDCLTALASGYGIEVPAEVGKFMSRKLRCCIPHHVQQYFDFLHEHLRKQKRAVASIEDAQLVYTRDLLSVRGQVDFEHYEMRLRQTLGPNAYRIALELLTEAATNDGLLSRDTAVRYRDSAPPQSRQTEVDVDDILLLLEHDGYLESCAGGMRFVSGLLEDWWRARHGQFFTSIAERES